MKMNTNRFSKIHIPNNECNTTDWIPNINDTRAVIESNSWFNIHSHKNTEKIYNNTKSCGIDLGINPFLTIYSPEKTYSIGNQIINYRNIVNVYRRRNNINNRINTEKLSTTKIKRLKKRLDKDEKKINNIITDMHDKVIYMLLNEYDNIYIGKLDESQIINNKNISDENKKILTELRIKLFINKLKQRAKYRNVNVEEINEYLTTQTCSSCGILNYVGRKKIYECTCGLRVDRDINSAKTHLKIGLNQSTYNVSKQSYNKNNNELYY